MPKNGFQRISAWALPVWLLATLDSCSFSSRASRQLLYEARQKGYDVIIVPGGPFDSAWSRVIKARMYWSKYLFDQGIARNIIFSGAAVYTPYVESRIMALYGEAIGIPKDHIFLETRAEHSTENAFYGYQKAKELHFQRIALASDPFQARLLKRFVRKKISPSMGLIPIVWDTLRSLESQMTDPAIDARQAEIEPFVPITRRQSIWKRLKGTLGWNIDRHRLPKPTY
jgi:hypothetical protein